MRTRSRTRPNPPLPTYVRGATEPLERGMEAGEDRERSSGGAGAAHHQAAAVPAPVAAGPRAGGAAAHHDSNSTDDDKVQWATYLQAGQSYWARGACPVCREEEEKRRGTGLSCGNYLPRPLPRLVHPPYLTWPNRIVQWIASHFRASQDRNPLESEPMANVRPIFLYYNVRIDQAD